MEDTSKEADNKIKRNIKACVFTDLFGDKRYLLKMYKSFHPEDEDVTEDDLEIVTLETVLVNDLYNDLGFNVRDRLICLVEAQSTWTMNILIRVLLYYSKTLSEYIKKRQIDLYGSVKARIPKPEFYVVFTGERADKPETINLAKEFFEGADIGLDVTVKMLYGEKDDIIGEYVTFTKVYNEQRKLYGRTEKAIRDAISICKDKNVLREYLESKEREVIDMMTVLFDEEFIMAAHDKTVLEQGVAQGLERGIAQGTIKGIVNTAKRYKATIQDTVSQVVDVLGISEQEATDAVKMYW